MASALATVPHQLATLTPDQLGAFASSLLRPSTPAAAGGPSPVGSPPVGSSPAAAHLAALEEAVALGVDLKLVALSAASSWLPFRNSRKQQLAAWVRELLGALAVGEPGARPDDDDAARIAALAGLYRGLKATRADNALVRDVEIEAAVAVEVALEAVSRGRRKGKAKAPAAGDGARPARLKHQLQWLGLIPPTLHQMARHQLYMLPPLCCLSYPYPPSVPSTQRCAAPLDWQLAAQHR
jgi:hypothetical protein